MPYGTVKVDNITFDNGGADQNVTASGIYRAITSGVAVSGVISGATLIGNFTVSGATVTGNTVQGTTVQGVSGTFTSLTGTTTTGTTANFVSGVFTTRVSGATITGTTAQFTSGTFVSLTGTTITGTTISGTTVSSTTGTFTSLTGETITGTTVNGTTVNSVTGTFTSLTGVTVTGTTANFVSGVFTTQVSGLTVTGTQSSFTSGNFITLSGTTANFVSGVFTTQVSGLTVTGTQASFTSGNFITLSGTTADFVSGVFTTRVSGATITGTTAQFTSGTFVSLTGTTITGTTISGTTVSSTTGTFTSLTGTTITGTTISGTTVSSTTGTFTSLTGVTVTGTTANFVSGVFTTRVSGLTVTGTQSSFTSGNFVTLSGATATFTSGVIASGLPTAPSLSILGDPNTGIYSPGADQVAISTNAVERVEFGTSEVVFNDGGENYDFRIEGDTNANLLFVDASTDRVGLGTSSPATQLHIEGNPANITLRDTDAASNGYFQIGARGGAGDLAILDVDPNNVIANSVFAINVDNTERLRITAAGSVGIGTTSPLGFLHIESPATTAGWQLRLDSVGLANESGFYRTAADNYEMVLRNGLGGLSYVTNTGGASTATLEFNVQGSERARIDSSGRLGLGTSSPGTLGGGAILNISPTGGGRIVIGSPNRYFYITGASGTEDLRFGRRISSDTVDSDIFTINGSTGNVGIGTTSPAETLEVAGNAILDGSDANLKIKAGTTGTTGAVNFTFNTDSTVYGGLDLSYDNRATDGVRLFAAASNYPVTIQSHSGAHIAFRGGATERARIDSSGRLLVGTSSAVSVNGTTAGLELHAIATTNGASASIARFNNDDSGPQFNFGKSRSGTLSPGTVVQSNDNLGEISFCADDGTDINSRAASITALVDGTPGADDMPGRLMFSTTADGAASPTEALRITNDRVIAYNQPTPTSKSAAATLTITELKTGIIQYTGAVATLTLPTGTLMEGGFSGIYTNMAFEWSVINTGTGICTIGAGTAHTIVGSATVAIGASARFVSRRTASNTFVSYCLS